MAGYITLSLGGYTVIFALTFLLLVTISIGILVYRQIQRLRNNSVRKTVNNTVALELSKKGREAILKGIEAVHLFRKAHFPKFTDCTMISEHANAAHVYRMIAFDEIIRDIDRQLEFINPELGRIPGESTYSYLMRIKITTLPELEDSFVARLGFLHEWCRFRPNIPFGKEELEEVRSHLRTFLSLLNKSQQLTSTCKLPVLSSFFLTKSKSLESSRTTNLDFYTQNSGCASHATIFIHHYHLVSRNAASMKNFGDRKAKKAYCASSIDLPENCAEAIPLLERNDAFNPTFFNPPEHKTSLLRSSERKKAE